VASMKITKTLLIVDDEIELCSLLQYFFEDLGYRVEVAYDGEAGVAKTKSIQPDLVLLDLRMPVVDGVEALKKIKQCSAAPVIMMTALADISLLEKCLNAGAHSYTLKPFDLDHLLRTIEDTLTEALEKQITPILWVEEMVTGDDEIDNDHKHLNQMLNEINAGFNDRVEMGTLHALFSDFLILCRDHFEKEEKFQEKIGYSEIKSHAKERQFLLVEAEKLERHLSPLEKSDTEKLDTFHLLQSFKILWFQHLLTADREILSCSSGF